jgi:hypothetical protein
MEGCGDEVKGIKERGWTLKGEEVGKSCDSLSSFDHMIYLSCSKAC